ncbi:MAG: hypothetical protein NXI04_19770 [Planctomycetaceae bacterium]|nr:hypothetical protein [Planctomycetaceae bacterium]
MKLSPWMLSVMTFVTTITLCSVYAARQLLQPASEGKAQAAATASTDTSAEYSRNKAIVREPPELQMVPVLLTDLLPGSTIRPEFVGEAPIRSSRIAAYNDTVLTKDALIGRTARRKISAATVLRLSMFYPVDRKPDVRMPPNLRLVSLPIKDQRALVGRYLQAGSYVDVLLTEPADTWQDVTVRKLFDGVRVFCVLELPAEGFEVLLELTCEQQLALQLARQRGQLTLTYNPAGPGREGVSLSEQNAAVIRGDMFVDAEARKPEASTAEDSESRFTSEHFRSGERSQTTFENASAIRK